MAYSMSNEGALLLVTQGTDAVWTWLEGLYHERFVAMPKAEAPEFPGYAQGPIYMEANGGIKGE
jgi:hypothetical protein